MVGDYTGLLTQPRVMQFALRYEFELRHRAHNPVNVTPGGELPRSLARVLKESSKLAPDSTLSPGERSRERRLCILCDC